MTNHERELGVLSAKMDQAERELAEIKADVREIRDALKEAKGGWRALMFVSGISGTIGAALTKAWPLIPIR